MNQNRIEGREVSRGHSIHGNEPEITGGLTWRRAELDRLNTTLIGLRRALTPIG
jgi:hypothetical protein